MGGKGKTAQRTNTAEEEEAKKREEDARRLAQEAESWIKMKKKKERELQRK